MATPQPRLQFLFTNPKPVSIQDTANKTSSSARIVLAQPDTRRAIADSTNNMPADINTQPAIGKVQGRGLVPVPRLNATATRAVVLATIVSRG